MVSKMIVYLFMGRIVSLIQESLLVLRLELIIFSVTLRIVFILSILTLIYILIINHVWPNTIFHFQTKKNIFLRKGILMDGPFPNIWRWIMIFLTV